MGHMSPTFDTLFFLFLMLLIVSHDPPVPPTPKVVPYVPQTYYNIKTTNKINNRLYFISCFESCMHFVKKSLHLFFIIC